MRTLLFAGATRPDLVHKLGAQGADAVVVDLEDAVPASAKEEARAAARELTIELASAGGGPEVYVRVNPPSSQFFAGDVAGALHAGLTGVVVPKCELPEQVERVREELAAGDLEDLELVLGIETAWAVANAEQILEAGARAVYFGAEDFIADMGGVRTAASLETLYARSRVALAARLAGIAAIDQAYVHIRDDDGFRADAAAGRSIGFGGKICLHPRQVELATGAFSPSAEELDWATGVLAAWEQAAASGVGATEFGGTMVDEPALKLARNLLARAAPPGQGSEA